MQIFYLCTERSEQKEAKKTTGLGKQKLILIDEIKQVETKRDMLIKTCDMLDKDFVRCVKDAEKKEDMSLLKKATALKRNVKRLKQRLRH